LVFHQQIQWFLIDLWTLVLWKFGITYWWDSSEILELEKRTTSFPQIGITSHSCLKTSLF
jgi:hypothetical protein